MEDNTDVMTDTLLNSTLNNSNEQLTQFMNVYKTSQDEHMKLLNVILNKIDNLEKTYTSINKDLINQNIKMCEILNGKLEEPDFEMPNNTDQQNENNPSKEKELFYYEKNGMFAIHGPGTFDNKHKIKSIGSCEWNSFNKTWDIVTTKDKLLETFPNIINKVK